MLRCGLLGEAAEHRGVFEEAFEFGGAGGFGFGGEHKHGADNRLDPATEPARIRAFFVDPAHARQGLARRILDACLHAAREAGFASIELAATLPGEPFYVRYGFEADERFEITLPGNVQVPLVRMHRAL